MSHPSRVSFALDADELREVTVYAMYKHIGGHASRLGHGEGGALRVDAQIPDS